MRSAALAGALVWIATAAHAGDGRVEINQACAATGCFAGDAAGFPVTIASSGSYVLTSDLALPSASASGVVVADGATLDLNGFGASPGSIVTENVVYANAEEGILVNSAVIRGNNVRSNGELGLAINFVDASSGFGDNVINDNNGGNANAQTAGGHQLGTNVCGDKTTCP